jgi:hypothetical protein
MFFDFLWCLFLICCALGLFIGVCGYVGYLIRRLLKG